MRILAILKKIIVDFAKKIKKDQAIPVLTWVTLIMIGLALVFSLVWLWPVLISGAILIGLARKFQIDTYKRLAK